MAIFYKALDNEGATHWGATEADARAYATGYDQAARIERLELDDMEARAMACEWLNFCEKCKRNAEKREKAKSAERKAEIAKKVWAKRRANGTDKWK